MAGFRLAKDIQKLRRHIATETNGQAKVVDVDDNLEFLLLHILPNDGPYCGARLRFKVYFTDCYPDEAPRLWCLDNVYHPNIDPSNDVGEDEDGNSNVCVSLMDEWDSEMGLDHMVLSLLFLMYHPNPEDALSPFFDSDSLDVDVFHENIRLTLSGKEFEDRKWACLLVEDLENADNMEGFDDKSETATVAVEPVDGANSDEVTDRTDVRDTAADGSTEVASTSGAEILTEIAGNEVIYSGSGDSSIDSETVSNTSSFKDDSHSNMAKTSLTDTQVLNQHNSALKDAFVPICPNFKGWPVISLEEGDCESCDEKCYSDSLGIARLFSCASFRVSRIKALFSCFHQREATAEQLPVTNKEGPSETADCDVD
ncbi:hypothetical protein ACOMHN_033288 [Nucella lapillus]